MNLYKSLAKEFFTEYAGPMRASRKLTQEKMAEQLRITPRAYGDLERGKYCFSASTLLFFLLAMREDELFGFLNGFRWGVRQLENGEGMPAAEALRRFGLAARAPAEYGTFEDLENLSKVD